VINGCSNAAFMCPPCHQRAEDREDGMGMDTDGKGFWLKHGTTPAYDPRNVPVVLHDGRTVWLAADGLGDDGSGYVLVPPGEVAA
jgi:hypothetical protein